MKALVTGGTGFIGSNLAKKLVDLGHDVTITGHHAENKIPGVTKFLNTHLTGIDWKALDKIDVVFHQAANNDTLDKDAHEMYLANVEGPKTLFKKAFECGCRQFVYASSTAVYGDAPVPYVEDKIEYILPLNAYGISKALFDSFAKDFGTENNVNVIGLRYCNVYGPGEEHKGKRASMIYQIYKQMQDGKNPRLFRDGNQKRDWCYVEDVIDINLLASKFEGREIFNVGTGAAVSFNVIVSLINRETDWNLSPEYFENPHADKYQNHTQCNIDKAKRLLGWTPKFDIVDGIKAYHHWLKNQ